MVRTIGRMLGAGLLLSAEAAQAGPPLSTDDADINPAGSWEVLAFTEGTRTTEDTEITTGLDATYSVSGRFELSLVLPVEHERDPAPRSGLGDIEAGAKILLAEDRDDSWQPALALTATLFIPTGDRDFTTGRVQPGIGGWAQKELGAWSLSGGAAHTFARGPGQRDQTLFGIAARHGVTDRLELGTELYHATPEEEGDHSVSRAALGATYALNDEWSVMASAGVGLHRPAETGRYTFFFGLQYTR